MSTLKKLVFFLALMLTSVNVFAEQLEGSGSPWGVKGTATVTSNFGYLGHTSYGAYGECESSGNYGLLGSDSYGVFGKYGSSNTYGFLGSSNYGVYGRHSSGNYGYLGTWNYGAYARNANGNTAILGDPTRGIYAYGTGTNSFAGHFSHSSGTYAYLAENAMAGHFKGAGTEEVHIGLPGIGLNARGSEYAGNFIGDVNISGDLYVSGDKDNVIKLDDGSWVTMSATEAPYPEYTISGRAKLVNGAVSIEFEEPYPQVISKEIPIKVIVTPEGSASLIYVKDVSVKGFTAASGFGDENATFNWIAIARVKGKEQKQDYKAVTAKMQRLEVSQKLLGLSTLSLPPSQNGEETHQAQSSSETNLSVEDVGSTGTVNIHYQLLKQASVTLSVFDVSGRQVKTLESGQAGAGNHTLSWDCTDDAGRKVSAGVYYVRLDDGTAVKNAKVTIIK